jgi:hypothetical protein
LPFSFFFARFFPPLFQLEVQKGYYLGLSSWPD